MQILVATGLLLLAYLIGSVPFGLMIVRLTTGKDIRKVESGRTGGTNAMRAAGIWAGLATTVLDLLKGAVAVWLARWLAPGNPWLEVLAPVMAVLGHNYSIFLMERQANGRIKLRGGAGGATAAGGVAGLWFPALFIVVPIAAVFVFVVGYASLATLSVAFMAILIFSYRAWLGLSPWEFSLYGLFAGVLLVIALLPNIKRLLNGTERVVGLRARGRKQTNVNGYDKKKGSVS